METLGLDDNLVKTLTCYHRNTSPRLPLLFGAANHLHVHPTNYCHAECRARGLSAFVTLEPLRPAPTAQ